MNASSLEVLGKYAGLAGFCVGLILVIFRAVLKLGVFPKLDVPDAYKLIRLLIIFTFAIGVIGILSWTVITLQGKNESKVEVQPHTITGHVSSKQTEKPIEHVQLYLGGIPGNAADSDFHGNFTLPLAAPLPVAGANLYAAFDGFQPFKTHVTDGQNVDVELIPATAGVQAEHAQSVTQALVRQLHNGQNPYGAGVAAGNQSVDHSSTAVNNAGTALTPATGASDAKQAITPPALPSQVQSPNPTQAVALLIDSARLNEWFQTGANGNEGFWPKSIKMTIDDQSFDIASNLEGASPSIPLISKNIALLKGTHTYGFRVELDEKVSKRLGMGSTHQSVFPECRKEFQVDRDMKVTPFLTVHAAKITQCLLLTASDPIPDRAQ